MYKTQYLLLTLISIASISAAQAQVLHKTVETGTTMASEVDVLNNADEPLMRAFDFIKQERGGVKDAQQQEYKPRHQASSNFVTGGAEAFPM